MANVSLQPAPDGPSTAELIGRVERGLYVVGDKSWSIDMQRFNFQFTGQRFYRIADGELVGQVRDAAYQATTTDFWGSMEAVGGPGDLGARRRVQLRQGPTRAGREREPRLPHLALPRRTHPQRQRRGGPLMTHLHAPVLRRARRGDQPGRRLRRDRPRSHQRQPAVGQQHPHHQRRHARRRRHRHLVHPLRRRCRGRVDQRQRHHPGRGDAPWSRPPTPLPGPPRPPRTPATWSGTAPRPTGTTRRCPPTSRCTTRSRRRWARPSAGPAPRAGCSTASSTTR